MPELRNYVTADEADAIRRYVADSVQAETDTDELPRIWAPITALKAPSGRASCRCCGNLIGKGEPAISFGFDPYSTQRDSGVWGRLATAYLHQTCPAEISKERAHG